jgi:hypothetical protein
MNKIEDIKGICKRPHLVQKGGMSLTEIALALGITYQQAKTSLETGLYKVGAIINDLKEEDSIKEYLTIKLVRPSFGTYKKTISNGDY